MGCRWTGPRKFFEMSKVAFFIIIQLCYGQFLTRNGLNFRWIVEKKLFLVLTSGEFLEVLGSGIGTGLVFCHSFSVSNNVYGIEKVVFTFCNI